MVSAAWPGSGGGRLTARRVSDGQLSRAAGTQEAPSARQLTSSRLLRGMVGARMSV